MGGGGGVQPIWYTGSCVKKVTDVFGVDINSESARKIASDVVRQPSTG